AEMTATLSFCSTAASAAGSRATTITLAPRSTRASTSPRPKPRLPPVTTIVLPLRFIVLSRVSGLMSLGRSGSRKRVTVDPLAARRKHQAGMRRTRTLATVGLGHRPLVSPIRGNDRVGHEDQFRPSSLNGGCRSGEAPKAPVANHDRTEGLRRL